MSAEWGWTTNLDRQNQISTLIEKQKHSDDMIEAAKTAHNVLVSELDKTKAELRDTKADLEDAQGTRIRLCSICYRLSKFAF